MDSFVMNGYLWRIKIVDQNSPKLVDRTKKLRVATTDPDDFCVYLSQELRGDFLIRVLIHELGHCVMFSYDMLDTIHSVVYPEYWIEAEEWICNFLADYGMRVFKIAYSIVGDITAWKYVPGEIEKWVA